METGRISADRLDRHLVCVMHAIDRARLQLRYFAGIETYDARTNTIYVITLFYVLCLFMDPLGCAKLEWIILSSLPQRSARYDNHYSLFTLRMFQADK